jgi:hypothetical protein
MYNILLQLLIIIHILIWLFIIFGGFISPTYSKHNIYSIIPLIYLLHMLPFHLLLESKLFIINNNNKTSNNNKSNSKILKENEDKYIIPHIFDKMNNMFSSSFANPLSPQGLLILGYIVNIYLLKYKWKDCIN